MAEQPGTGPGEPDALSARERILATAERLFAERGFDRTSTARIAAAAGVPQGLIFYHFKTKMDLLLAATRTDRWSALDDVVPPLAQATGLAPAVVALWQRMSAVLGEPSAARKIILQEAGAHPEIQARALEYQDRITAMVADYLARASSSPAPGPEHEAAARLLTITAGLAPLVGQPGAAVIAPADLAALITAGLG